MALTSKTIGPYVVGEIPPPLSYTFLDSTGAAIDLSAGYSARFSYGEQSGAPVMAAAVISAPASGTVTYTFTGAEFTTAGHYRMEFWVGNGTNRLCSILLEADVRAPVGSVPVI